MRGCGDAGLGVVKKLEYIFGQGYEGLGGARGGDAGLGLMASKVRVRA